MDDVRAINKERSLVTRLRRLREAARLHVLLDYDGTLVPFAPLPDLAEPDEELVDLLLQLACRPRTEVHLLSGRDRRWMENWFGGLPLVLHAEDGYWSRHTPGGAWVAARIADLGWKDPVIEILADLTRRTEGSFLEKKTASVAWHYRMAEPPLAAARLKEARLRIGALGRYDAFELIEGPMVLEVRNFGISKRRIVAMTLGPVLGSVVAAGDDPSDETLFDALPPNAVTIHVGSGPTHAPYSVVSPRALRRALRVLVRGTA